MPQPLTITLSPHLAEKVRIQAASFGYSDESMYVEDQMSDAVESDSDLEQWLSAVGVARYDAYDANPKDVLSCQELRAKIAARRQRRSNIA